VPRQARDERKEHSKITVATSSSSTASDGWKRAASAVNAVAILAPAGKPDAEPSQSEHQQARRPRAKVRVRASAGAAPEPNPKPEPEREGTSAPSTEIPEALPSAV
jgi:hypothetical protein